MNLTSNLKSIRPLTYYSVSVFFVASLLTVFIFKGEMVVSSYSTFIISVLSLLLIWRFGIRFPYIGIVSMARLVQFFLLFTVPLFDVVIINMCAAFIMPFINKSYRFGSYKVAFLRGLSNAGMNTFMLIIGGFLLYYYLDLPLVTIGIKHLLVILMVAIVIQIINIGMIAIYHTVDNKDFKKLLNPTFVLADLIFVPAGVLLAILFQNSDKSMFWLFIFFLLIILFSFKVLQSENKASDFTFKGTDYKSDFLDINSVCFAIMRRISNLFKYDCVYLGSFNQDMQVLELYIKHSKNKLDIISETELIKISEKRELQNSLIEHKTKLGKVKKYAVISAPFKNQDGIFAFMCVVKKSSVVFSIADVNLFELMVHRYEMGLSYAINYKNLSEYKNTLEARVISRTKALKQVNNEKSKLVEELQSMAQRDGLTGLFNRRYIDNVFDNCRMRRPDKLSLAMIDIDFFKKVNDDYGHETGDNVLKQLAKIFNEENKSGLNIARYGGEEFVILFHNTSTLEVVQFCQYLLETVSGFDWSEVAESLKITISIGLSHYPSTKISKMFKEADKNLYLAKTSGRNQLQPQIGKKDND